MSLTALQIAQSVVDELGLPAITFITNNTNTTVRQVVSLMNRAGDEIYQAAEWTHAQNLAVINIGPPVVTTGNTTAGSDVITNIPSTAAIVANYFAVDGDYLITSTRVAEVLSATSVRVDQPATQTAVGSELIFARDTFARPDNFAWFIDHTMWDRTNRWELIGPVSPQTDEYNRSGVVTTGPRRRWREIGLPQTCWRLWPPPTAPGSYPATLVFEYVWNTWAQDAVGAPVNKLSADGDVPLIDAQAIILSTKWRLWQVKGFEYGAMQAEYIDYMSRLVARDGGSPDLSLAKPYQSPNLLTPASVPDGFWPGPGNP